jgi:hypothetical protein
MKTRAILCLAMLQVLPAFAMPNRQRDFRYPCEDVWKAAVAVAKTKDYRIVSLSAEERIVSLAAGGAWWGERMITLSLGEDKEGGCIATVQSRFSGLAHADGPDLLSRLGAEVLVEKSGLDKNSKEFRRYQDCLTSPKSNQKCEERFESDVAKMKKAQPQAPSDGANGDWWKNSKPSPSISSSNSKTTANLR